MPLFSPYVMGILQLVVAMIKEKRARAKAAAVQEKE